MENMYYITKEILKQRQTVQRSNQENRVCRNVCVQVFYHTGMVSVTLLLQSDSHTNVSFKVSSASSPVGELNLCP